MVVHRETPNGNLYLVEKIREGGVGVLAAHREFDCHNEPLVIWYLGIVRGKVPLSFVGVAVPRSELADGAMNDYTFTLG